jgi:hypothetical protein
MISATCVKSTTSVSQVGNGPGQFFGSRADWSSAHHPLLKSIKLSFRHPRDSESCVLNNARSETVTHLFRSVDDERFVWVDWSHKRHRGFLCRIAKKKFKISLALLEGFLKIDSTIWQEYFPDVSPSLLLRLVNVMTIVTAFFKPRTPSFSSSVIHSILFIFLWAFLLLAHTPVTFLFSGNLH